MDVSVIYPVKNQNQLAERIKEIHSFFQKFPLALELVFVCEPGIIPPEVQNTDKIKNVFILNEKPLGRGASVLKGLSAFKNQYAIVASIDFSVPLSEYYSFFIEAYQDSSIDLLIGDTTTAKRKSLGTRNWIHQSIFDIYNQRYQQKLQNLQLIMNDPLCSFLAIKKQAFEKIQNELKNLPWFYSVELLIAFQKANLKIKSLPILYRKNEQSKIPKTRLLLTSVFGSFD